MAATLTLRGEKREGNIRLSSRNGLPVIEETFSFLVETDDNTVTRLDVLTFDELPVVNFTTSSSGLTVCKTKSATRREDNSYLWDIVCEFSSEVDEDSSEEDPESDPNEWVPIYETKFERLQEVVTEDASGDPIANSAGQPFQNGLTRSRFIPIWEFYQFEPATVTDEQIIERNETVNDAVFKGRAAKTLLLTVQSSVIGYYYGQRRRLTKYSLKYNEKDWMHKRLDVGTVYKSGSNYLPYLDNEGNVMLGPLNGSGGKQAVGTAPAILTFDVYATSTFSSFLRT